MGDKPPFNGSPYIFSADKLAQARERQAWDKLSAFVRGGMFAGYYLGMALLKFVNMAVIS